MSNEAMKQVVKEAVYHRGGYWIIPEKDFSSLRQAIAEAEKQEPVLVVEKEPDYMSGGHFHTGTKPHIDPTKVWNLPIGTKLYTHPQPKREPCLTCNGHGLIGGFVSADSGYDSEPCPDCNPQPKRESLTDKQWQIMADTLHCAITRKQKDVIEAALGITSDMKQEPVAKTAKQRHEENT